MIEKILASIPTIMTKTTLTKPFYEAVLQRLVSFGYELKESDAWVLGFTMQKVENHILNSCNIASIPDGLFHIAVDMVVGEFLLAKKTFSPDDLTGFNLDYAVKQIQMGDTSTTFATGDASMTPEQRLTTFIDYLLSYGKAELVTFRRIRW